MKYNGHQYRIVIADDQTLFRRGLRTLLGGEHDVDVVGEAGTFAEALDHSRSMAIDVLVVNVALLGDTPESWHAAARQLAPQIHVVFLSADRMPVDVEALRRAGVPNYLSKETSPAELLAGICRIFRSEQRSPRLSGDMSEDLRALARSSRSYPAPSVLTPREHEILKLLAEGRTVRETAGELALSMKTVEAHKLNLMRKLDIHDRPKTPKPQNKINKLIMN